MGNLRVPALLTFAVILAGCATHTPVLDEAQDDVSTETTQPDRTATLKVKSEAKKPKLQAPKPTAASATPQKDTTNSIPANVGSPQKWEKERAEDERKEQRLKQVIEGICRGC